MFSNRTLIETGAQQVVWEKRIKFDSGFLFTAISNMITKDAIIVCDFSGDVLEGYWVNTGKNEIDEKRYDVEMKEEGIRNILKFGIAFSGKEVIVKTK